MAMTLEEVGEYLAKHKLEEIIADAVNDAVEKRSPDPLEHVAQYLRAANKPALRIVEPHHHFLAPDQPHAKFIAGLGIPSYTPEDDVKDTGALPVTKSVHVEAMPDDGLGEATWVESLIAAGRCQVAGIVASANLADADAEAQLDALAAQCPHLRGIRYILDFVGPFDGKSQTHIATKRHGFDYLRDATEAPKFERGFALLAKHKLSFDLQCAPEQLPAAAALFARHPDVPVVVDHLGKPYHLRADGGEADAAELALWRKGMGELAKLPQVHVKLSMLGYSVPGWASDASKEAFLKELVLEVIALFGAERCMFSSNWHLSGPVSNSDGADSDAITKEQLWARYHSWVSNLPEADVARLMAGTAESFYRI